MPTHVPTSTPFKLRAWLRELVPRLHDTNTAKDTQQRNHTCAMDRKGVQRAGIRAGALDVIPLAPPQSNQARTLACVFPLFLDLRARACDAEYATAAPHTVGLPSVTYVSWRWLGSKNAREEGSHFLLVCFVLFAMFFHQIRLFKAIDSDQDIRGVGQ